MTKQSRSILILGFFCLFIWFAPRFLVFEKKEAAPVQAEILFPLTIPEKILAGYKISVNELSEKDWEALPKIGPKTAQAIIAYRQEYGPFKNLENLLDVKGIGPKTLENLKSYLAP